MNSCDVVSGTLQQFAGAVDAVLKGTLVDLVELRQILEDPKAPVRSLIVAIVDFSIL